MACVSALLNCCEEISSWSVWVRVRRGGVAIVAELRGRPGVGVPWRLRAGEGRGRTGAGKLVGAQVPGTDGGTGCGAVPGARVPALGGAEAGEPGRAVPGGMLSDPLGRPVGAVGRARLLPGAVLRPRPRPRPMEADVSAPGSAAGGCVVEVRPPRPPLPLARPVIRGGPVPRARPLPLPRPGVGGFCVMSLTARTDALSSPLGGRPRVRGRVGREGWTGGAAASAGVSAGGMGSPLWVVVVLGAVAVGAVWAAGVATG